MAISTTDNKFKYGTAGFRMQEELLDQISERMGLFASLLSQCLGGKAVGLMITASHNPEADNGIKLVGPDGAMAPIQWEAFAEKIVNVPSSGIPSAMNDVRSNFKSTHKSGAVIVGRDTRKSGSRLSEEVKKGVLKDCKVIELGQVTTPQLHYAVHAFNHGIKVEKLITSYYDDFIGCYPKRQERKKLTIDFANGVGFHVKKHLMQVFGISGINEGDGALNEECGADFVKSKKALPRNFVGTVGYSFDGDADRLIGYMKEGHDLVLFDGDRIAALLASFLQKQSLPPNTKVGIVHTAYSNGAFIEYCQKFLGIQTECVPTGVKHLHHAALKYDIGIYFEANGHGTVLFNPTIDWSQYLKVETLRKCLNQLVGDALSDLLAVEFALIELNWSYSEWARIYKERANRLYKIAVNDRPLYKTNASEEKIIKPEGLQEKIDAIVSQYKDSRAFVRPSGTENILRLYVEGPNDAQVELLAEGIKKLF